MTSRACDGGARSAAPCEVEFGEEFHGCSADHSPTCLFHCLLGISMLAPAVPLTAETDDEVEEVVVTATGETELDERNRATQPAVTTINLQIGFEGDRYSMRLFGENLTDERRFSGLAFDNLGFGTDGNYYGPLDAPRIVGVELEAKW